MLRIPYNVARMLYEQRLTVKADHFLSHKAFQKNLKAYCYPCGMLTSKPSICMYEIGMCKL